MKTYQSPASFKSGRYIPQKVLGTGTYGQVLCCTDVTSGENVAVKVAQKEAAYRRSALNEIGVLQCLRGNPDVVTIYDSFEQDGHVCIVTELLQKNLYEDLRARNFGPLSFQDIRHVGMRVLGALDALHRCNLIHCDIKPENIMLRCPANQRTFSMQRENSNYICVSYDSNTLYSHSDSSLSSGSLDAYSVPYPSGGSVCTDQKYNHTCLIDFGAVRQLNENTYFDVQSLWYRAPEVLCGFPYSTKIDAWSVGCLLYELCTGKPLFPGESPHEQLGRIVQLLGYPSQVTRTIGASSHLFPCHFPSLPPEVVEANMRSLLAEGRRAAFERLKYSQSPRDGSILQHNNDKNAANAMQASSSEEDAFLNLLLQLLHPDENQRLSCSDALAHRFFCVSPDGADHSPSLGASSAAMSGWRSCCGLSDPPLWACRTPPAMSTIHTSHHNGGVYTALRNGASALSGHESAWSTGPMDQCALQKRVLPSPLRIPAAPSLSVEQRPQVEHVMLLPSALGYHATGNFTAASRTLPHASSTMAASPTNSPSSLSCALPYVVRVPQGENCGCCTSQCRLEARHPGVPPLRGPLPFVHVPATQADQSLMNGFILGYWGQPTCGSSSTFVSTSGPAQRAVAGSGGWW